MREGTTAILAIQPFKKTLVLWTKPQRAFGQVFCINITRNNTNIINFNKANQSVVTTINFDIQIRSIPYISSKLYTY